MKKIIFLSIFLCSTLVIFCQDKKAITHEDLWLMRRVGIPAVSPNGEQVIFSIAEPSYDDKELSQDIFICATKANQKMRKLTSSKGGESAYAWSPDGSMIAFSAKREGDDKSQIYIMNIKEGGEAQRLTNLSTGASNPKWSPDSKRILFSSNVYPQCFADSSNKKKIEEEKKIKFKARVYDNFPIRDWDSWIEDRQTHFFIQDIAEKSEAKNIFNNVNIAKEKYFKASSAIWSSDGRSIVFTASVDGNVAAYQESTTHVYTVPVDSGDAKQITNGNFSHGNVILSSDSKYLFCLRNAENTGKIYNERRLMRYDYPSMNNPKQLFEKMDRPISTMAIAENKLYLTIENQGRDEIYELNYLNNEYKKFSPDGKGCYNNVSCTNGKNPIVVCNYESAVMPAEIVLLNANQSSQFISYVNKDKLATLDLPEIETIITISSRQKNIRSIIIKPAGFDPSKKYPLFVLMHGGPAGSWKENWGYRWNYHLLSKPGYIVIGTDFTGSTGYGEAFSQDIQFDPFRGPADEIQEAAADAITRFAYINGDIQAAGGASYGGHLANWMQATTSHYKCLISHAGLVNSVSQWGSSDVIYGRELMNGSAPWISNKTWEEQNPFRYAKQFKTPMLITIGELDYRVPINNSIENFYIHQRLKIPSKLIVFPEENHWILKAENSKFFYQEIHNWLAQYLK